MKHILNAVMGVCVGMLIVSIVLIIFYEKPQPSNKGEYNVVTVWSDSSQIVFDAGTMNIYDNVFSYQIDYPGSYVYECITTDSVLSASFIYSKIPYQIPADGEFHEVLMGDQKVYLKFKEVKQ